MNGMIQMVIVMFSTGFKTVMIRKYSVIYACKCVFLYLIFQHPEIKNPPKVFKSQNREIQYP